MGMLADERDRLVQRNIGIGGDEMTWMELTRYRGFSKGVVMAF